MIENLWLIGIGTGNPAHVTHEGADALRNAAVILLPTKGDDKEDLAHLRRAIITASGSTARIVPFEYPMRDPDLPYMERVAAWHDEIARRWITALQGQSVDGPVALLVLGDPSLYDSTIRIAERLFPKPAIRVVPGITAIQALTAAHAIPLNTVDGPVRITTGRQLRETGLPKNETTAVVMLDGLCSFQHIDPIGIHIWWGAYLGSEKEILIEGALVDVGQKIVDKRGEARAANGWIMDSYLLRRI